MQVRDTVYKLVVWSGVAIVGAAFLLWLSEILIGLILVGSVLYTAIHLLTRFGEWYADTFVSNDRAPRTPLVSSPSPSVAVRDPTSPARDHAVGPGDEDFPSVPEDEAGWQPVWQVDDAARAQADQDLDGYYRELADEGRGCAADYEWEPEESQLEAAE